MHTLNDKIGPEDTHRHDTDTRLGSANCRTDTGEANGAHDAHHAEERLSKRSAYAIDSGFEYSRVVGGRIASPIDIDREVQEIAWQGTATYRVHRASRHEDVSTRFP
jgi:hypothetical protein